MPGIAAICCKVWLGPRDRSKLLQSLAGWQGSQQAAAKSGWAPGIAASCCKVRRGARDRSKLLQSLAGRQGSQQAAAKSAWAPGIAAICCKAWLGPRDRSKLLLGVEHSIFARGLRDRTSPTCTLSQNGYGVCQEAWSTSRPRSVLIFSQRRTVESDMAHYSAMWREMGSAWGADARLGRHGGGIWAQMVWAQVTGDLGPDARLGRDGGETGPKWTGPR